MKKLKAKDYTPEGIFRFFVRWLLNHPVRRQIVRKYPRTGRNERCPCGSNMKYKFCHWPKYNM